MTELIKISTGEQGSPVVSARELHTYFEVKTEFAKWSKRMFEYGFTEGQDYVQVFAKNDENSTVGRPLTDYALTLDCAKEIAMLQRSEKGKQVRQYFIETEKNLSQPAIPSTTEQILIQLVSQQNQLMAGTQELLSQLRSDVDSIIAGNHLPPPPPAPRRNVGRQLGLPGIPAPIAPQPSLRQQINRKIDEYCEYQGYDRLETFRYLYRRMFEVYAVNVNRLNRAEGESIIDAIERYGRLNDLYKLVTNELH